MAHGLHRVGVKEHLVGPGDAAQLGDRLYGADPLLAAMMEIRMVSGRIAPSRAAGSTSPRPSTGR